MLYGKYKKSRDASWQALIDFEVSALPVSPYDICVKAGIKTYRDSDVRLLRGNEIGLAIFYDGCFRIIIDDSQILTRRRFTLAHELGHILLGHVLTDSPRGRVFDTSKPSTETEADVFASRLLAPACVLWGLGLRTPEEISEACGISMQAASIRAERMDELYRRGKFLTSPLERQVYGQFEEFIKNNGKKGN